MVKRIWIYRYVRRWKEVKLRDVSTHSLVKVENIEAQGELKRRFSDLGIINGTNIEVLYRSPFGDPTAYLIRGAIIAMREEESGKINVLIIN